MSNELELEKKTREELKDLLISMGWFEVDVPKTKKKLIEKIMEEYKEMEEECRKMKRDQRYP